MILVVVEVLTENDDDGGDGDVAEDDGADGHWCW